VSERPALIEKIRGWAQACHKRVIAHFHQLHRHPELSWREERTASYLEQTLRDLELSPERQAGTGVVVDLPGNANLPRRALRADIDAVATHEATGLPHASENAGVMHACGHDAHAAILLGVAEILQENKAARRRPLRLIFQPAEETIPSGAMRLIDEGVLEGVADIISLHVWPAIPSGTVGLREGVLAAAADAFECLLKGPGGHGARPYETVDLIALAAQVIPVLVDIPRTHLNPLMQPTVISIGTIHGGKNYNVIPDQVRFGGTVRTLDRSVRDAIPEQMETIIRNLAQPAGAEYDFLYQSGSPPMKNDPQLSRLAVAVTRELYGPRSVVHLEHPSMGSEDFAHFTERVPGLLLRLGCAAEGTTGNPLHSSIFQVDEQALAAGVGAMTALALV
jgi:amidohydrolase